LLLPGQSHHTDNTVLHYISISMLPLHRWVHRFFLIFFSQKLQDVTHLAYSEVCYMCRWLLHVKYRSIDINIDAEDSSLLGCGVSSTGSNRLIPRRLRHCNSLKLNSALGQCHILEGLNICYHSCSCLEFQLLSLGPETGYVHYNYFYFLIPSVQTLR